MCSNPNHEHETTVNKGGGELSAPAPMSCDHCGRPSHWDETVGDYAHDDPTTPSCFLIPAYAGQPCINE